MAPNVNLICPSRWAPHFFHSSAQLCLHWRHLAGSRDSIKTNRSEKQHNKSKLRRHRKNWMHRNIETIIVDTRRYVRLGTEAPIGGFFGHGWQRFHFIFTLAASRRRRRRFLIPSLPDASNRGCQSNFMLFHYAAALRLWLQSVWPQKCHFCHHHHHSLLSSSW